jgi:hypothetical protein
LAIAFEQEDDKKASEDKNDKKDKEGFLKKVRSKFFSKRGSKDKDSSVY